MAATLKTLTDLINREDRYDINKIMFYTATDDQTLVIEETTLFDIYFKYIKDYVAEYEVSREEQRFYRYRPQLLSRDVYGTPSLAWMILRLNDRECPSKFTIKDTIKLIPSDLMGRVYETFVTKSDKRLRSNHNTYIRMVGEEVGES